MRYETKVKADKLNFYRAMSGNKLPEHVEPTYLKAFKILNL